MRVQSAGLRPEIFCFPSAVLLGVYLGTRGLSSAFFEHVHHAELVGDKFVSFGGARYSTLPAGEYTEHESADDAT